MKRFLTLILALCLVLSLAACGGDSTTPTTAAKTEAATKAPETEAQVTTTEAVVTTTEAPVTTEAPTTEAPATTEGPAALDAKGRYEGDAYINEYLNLKIQKPQGWIFYTEEQIAQVNNTTVELFEDTDVSDLIAKNGQLMDLMMSGVSGGNVNLILQNSQPALDLYTDEQIFTLSQATIEAQLKAAGMEIKNYESVPMQVGGEEHTVLHMTVSVSGVGVDEYQIWLRPEGDYMGVVTVSVPEDADVQPILDGIAALN